MNEQQRKAMELALDLAIMHHSDEGYSSLRARVQFAIKEALAQPSDSVETPIDFELAYGEIYKNQRAALSKSLAQPAVAEQHKQRSVSEHLEPVALPEQRPIESDYVSQVAYTRALEAYCDRQDRNRTWIEEAFEASQIEQPAQQEQRKATTYAERFTHAVTVLCGAQPPADMVAEWIENVEVNGEHRLQGWVLTQAATPFWAQGIVVLDAAHVLANDPEEGEGHEAAPQPPQRKPLTDEEILNEYCVTPNVHQFISAFKAGARFAEAAHGIKE